MVKHSRIYNEKLAAFFERCFLFLFTFFGAQLGYWVNFVIDGKLNGIAFYLFVSAISINCLLCAICFISEIVYLNKVDKIEINQLKNCRNNRFDYLGKTQVKGK